MTAILDELIELDEKGEYNFYKRMPETVFNHPLWLNTKFDDKSAMIDLYNLAFDSYEGDYTYTFPRGQRMKIYAGEVCHSLDTLARRWKWSKKAVRKYLDDMEIDGLLEIRNTHPGLVIKLTDYPFKENKKLKEKRNGNKGYTRSKQEAF